MKNNIMEYNLQNGFGGISIAHAFNVYHEKHKTIPCLTEITFKMNKEVLEQFKDKILWLKKDDSITTYLVEKEEVLLMLHHYATISSGAVTGNIYHPVNYDTQMLLASLAYFKYVPEKEKKA